MEEQRNQGTSESTTTSSQPSTGQAMDLLPRPVPVQDASDSEKVSQSDTTEAPHEEPLATPSSENSADSPESQSSESAAAPTNISVTDAESTKSDHSDDHNPMAIHPEQHHASSTPVVAIVIAILIALVLAGVVMFMYMKSKNQQSLNTASSSTSSNQPVAAKPQASVSDVDTTTTQIDDNLKKIDDSKDFPATSLSDSTLGL